MLQAQPPRGHKLTAEDLDRSVDIMRNRVDKLGVSEPEIRKQAPNQIVIQLPASTTRTRRPSIIGQTAQLELYDLETSLVPPSVDAAQNPVAFTSLYDLLVRVQSGAEGRPGAVLAVQLAHEEARRRPVRDARPAQEQREGPGAQASRRRRRRAKPPASGLLTPPDSRRLPDADDAEGPRRDHVLRPDGRRLPGRAGLPSPARPTTTSSSTTRTRTRRRPADERRRC